MEYKNVLEGLKNIYERATKLGDDALSIVENEKNPEVKAMITELSNQCYSLAMDAKDNAETYRDLMDEEADQTMDNFEELPEEPEGEEPVPAEGEEEIPANDEGEDLEPVEGPDEEV